MRISDWSSDVCSSDLPHARGEVHRDGHDELAVLVTRGREIEVAGTARVASRDAHDGDIRRLGLQGRSAVRRVVKEWVSTWRALWSPHPLKKKPTTSIP